MVSSQSLKSLRSASTAFLEDGGSLLHGIDRLLRDIQRTTKQLERRELALNSRELELKERARWLAEMERTLSSYASELANRSVDNKPADTTPPPLMVADDLEQKSSVIAPLPTLEDVSPSPRPTLVAAIDLHAQFESLQQAIEQSVGDEPTCKRANNQSDEASPAVDNIECPSELVEVLSHDSFSSTVADAATKASTAKSKRRRRNRR
jgi:hypothetical protein